MTIQPHNPDPPVAASFWHLRKYRFRRIAAVTLAISPPILCAYLAETSGNWEWFERSGSITTAVGCRRDTGRCRYSQTRSGALRIRNARLGVGKIHRLVELQLSAGVGTVRCSGCAPRFQQGEPHLSRRTGRIYGVNQRPVEFLQQLRSLLQAWNEGSRSCCRLSGVVSYSTSPSSGAIELTVNADLTDSLEHRPHRSIRDAFFFLPMKAIGTRPVVAGIVDVRVWR